MSEDISLLELFRDEARVHSATLASGLVELEGESSDPRRLEPLMRAAHSIKGAARIVAIEPAVHLAHAMEDVFVAAGAGKVRLGSNDIDVLLRGADLLATLVGISEANKDAWGEAHAEALKRLLAELPHLGQAAAAVVPRPARPVVILPAVPSDEPMWELFREELRGATRALLDGVASEPGEPMMQAARAIRGAAMLAGLPAPAGLASAIETALVAAREAGAPLDADGRGAVERGVAVLAELLEIGPAEAAAWEQRNSSAMAGLRTRLEARRLPVGPLEPPPPPEPSAPAEPVEAVVRVSAASLSRLMGLAGESLVQARWLGPFAASLMALKKGEDRLAALLDAGNLAEARRQALACRQALAERTREFEDHAARAEDLNGRLYREVITSRMRPFADGAHGFPRLVRDMARALGKQAKLEIEGLATEVDRDVLERLEAPLMHLLRNALDHGIEPPDDRRAAGKAESGTIRMVVRHRAGMLAITVSDDGAGIDPSRLRQKVAERGLATPEMARRMGEAELLEFLFLPGFSTATEVTEYSGRGVGLDVVQDTVRRIGGSARISTRPGRGCSFHLQLPLTLSVVRAVLADVAGEPYAFPHNRIDRLLRVPRGSIRSLEHRQFVSVDGQNVGLVLAAQLLGLPPAADPLGDLPVVLMGDAGGLYGLVVEAFRGEQDLVVRPLDPRLGKVPNVSAAAILDDGSPVLVADVEDMIRGMDAHIQEGSLARTETAPARIRRKRILVVDDSITVREAERQILRHAGYDVAVAVDGADGWNQVRTGAFDLVVSDVDMPRMDGLALLRAIRGHDGLKGLPVVVVSYKDRAEDREKGMEAGASRYLTKSSFHDDTFLKCVADLLAER